MGFGPLPAHRFATAEPLCNPVAADVEGGLGRGRRRVSPRRWLARLTHQGAGPQRGRTVSPWEGAQCTIALGPLFRVLPDPRRPVLSPLGGNDSLQDTVLCYTLHITQKANNMPIFHTEFLCRPGNCGTILLRPAQRVSARQNPCSPLIRARSPAPGCLLLGGGPRRQDFSVVDGAMGVAAMQDRPDLAGDWEEIWRSLEHLSPGTLCRAGTI